MKETVFITGASSGIGRSTARLFQERGWNVAATMRNPDQAGDWIKHDRTLGLHLDVTDGESIQAAMDRAVTHFGAVDVLVNNAGYGAVGPFEASTPEQVERQIATNVTGLMNVTRAFLPHFRERRRGCDRQRLFGRWADHDHRSTASTMRPNGRWRASPRRWSTNWSRSASE